MGNMHTICSAILPKQTRDHAMSSPLLDDLVKSRLSSDVLGIKVNGFTAQEIQEAHSVWARVDLGFTHYQMDECFP